MKSRGKSSSEKFVSAVIGFIAGTHLHQKPRPTTLSLMQEGLRVRRMSKELERSCAVGGKRR